MTVLDLPARATAVEVNVWRAVFTALAGLLYGAGWVARKTVIGVAFAVVWCCAAIKLGWQDAGVTRGPAR